MSNSFNTLADLVKLNDKNAKDLGLVDLLNKAPALASLFATTSSDSTTHKYIKQTGAPTSAFRSPNAGKANSASSYTEVSVTLALFDNSFTVDKAICDAYLKGPDAFLARESKNQLQQGFYDLEKQIWYGTTLGNAAGFSGFHDDSHFNTVTGTGTTVINAAGTTAATGSSVWLVRSTDDEQGVAAVLGNQGQITIGNPFMTTRVDDSDATKSYNAWSVPIMGYCGVQIGMTTAISVARICNLTADSGKGLTDTLMSKAFQLFPSYAPPTHIFMNRRSLGQLQQARVTYSPIGSPAPFPSDWEGVKIVVTDSISSTEALLT